MNNDYGMYHVAVPGTFLGDKVAFLDLETRKVPCEWYFPSGERLRRRWSAFLAGVATAGEITIVETASSEREFLQAVRDTIGKADTVIYRATRQFDEMILKGRFTNARRALASEPFFTVMPGAEDLTWDCRKHDPGSEWQALRVADIPSKDVPVHYELNPGLVMLHLLRDVAELVGAYGQPDAQCEAWLRKVLTDPTFADSVLYAANLRKVPETFPQDLRTYRSPGSVLVVGQNN